MANNIASPAFPSLSWEDETQSLASLESLYQYAEDIAQDAINWYLEHKRKKQWIARSLRFSAIALTALGGIVPFLVAGKFLGTTTTYEWSQLGYISLALAAACVGLDKFFGYSSGWIRYITTGLVLQRLHAEFQLDWAVLNANLALIGPSRIQQNEVLIRRVQTFVLRIREEIEKETAEWATEYRSNLTELEKTAREQLQAWQPGVINVTIPNVGEFKEGVAVLLDGRLHQTVTMTTCQIAPVYPGSHVVSVTGILKTDGKSANASSATTVISGQTIALTLEPKPTV